MGALPQIFFPGKLGLGGSGFEACGVGCFPADLVLEAAGLPGCEAGEFLLDEVDAVGHVGWSEVGFSGGEFGLLGGVEDPGGEESLVGGAGLVVELR